MGSCCSAFQVSLPRRASSVNKKIITLLMVGPDGAGKTTVLRRLSGEPLDGVVPTVGFSTTTLQQKGSFVTLYDLGGGPQIRGIWPRYYTDAHGIIFVMDASNVQRVDECRKILDSVLRNPAISGKPVLLLANKQDLEGALDEIDIVERLNIEPLVNEEKCPTLVELCSARVTTKKVDIGIDNGFKWLLRCINKEYPSLNNRVLLDVARQAERDRIELAQRDERVRIIREEREALENEVEPFKPYQNGIAKHTENRNQFHGQLTRIPGSIDDDDVTIFITEKGPSQRERENFNMNESNADLLQFMGQETDRNFLVRPKSSGARLYPNKSETGLRKNKKRKKLTRSNKLGPEPFTALEKEPNGPLPKVFDPTYYTDISVISNHVDKLEMETNETCPLQHLDMFLASGSRQCFQPVPDPERRKSMPEHSEQRTLDLFRAKSMPNSRKNSADSKYRRFSGKLPPLEVKTQITDNHSSNPVVLDVTVLDK